MHAQCHLSHLKQILRHRISSIKQFSRFSSSVKLFSLLYFEFAYAEISDFEGLKGTGIYKQNKKATMHECKNIHY